MQQDNLAEEQNKKNPATGRELSIPVSSLYAQGLKMLKRKAYDQAEGVFKTIADHFPKEVRAMLHLAQIARMRGHHAMAFKRYERVYAIAPKDPDVLLHFGGYLLEQKDNKRAAEYLEQATRHRLSDGALWTSLGRAYENIGDQEKAIGSYKKATEVEPKDGNAWLNLGKVCHLTKKHEEGLKYYNKALKILPDNLALHNNLGSLLKTMGRYDDAEALYKRGLQIDQKAGGILYNMGNLMKEQSLCNKAIYYFEKALEISPNAANIHWNLSLALLAKGDIERGFDEYRWRWDYDEFPTKKRNFIVPEWDGAVFYKKTLLIYLEQGMGDLMQFARWIPEVVKKKGAGSKIIIECHAPLVRLLSNFEGVDQVLLREEEHPHFDLQIPYLTLPAVFKETLITMPQKVPYIVPPESAESAKVKEGFARDKNLKVGLVWAGNPKHKNDKNRSSSLENLRKILDMENITFYSLQKGERVKDIETLGLQDKIINLDHKIDDFLDTAHIINNLDLVITVDTSVAHLTGALGKPLWVMLPFSCDWRWMTNRDDSPWYPSARLFRQDKKKEWKTLIPALRDGLKDLAYYKKTLPQT
ncbi:MAG: tetratricopeptide repeat protein [Alphaproteobacteria bacterium]